MKFVSIRQKLISRVSLIFIVSFAVVLSLVAYMSTTQSQLTLKKTEDSIRESLTEKGRLLVKNNSQALTGPVEDNAFTQVQEIVSNTVADDVDMSYGIFIDVDGQPWVYAHESNKEGNVTGDMTFDDETSQWAAALEALDNKLVEYNGQQVYEFAAPIIDEEEEILGVLRYALSTERMQRLVAEEAEASKQTLIQTLGILFVVGLVAIFGGYFGSRKIAETITEPLNELRSAAETIASGDYSSEVSVVTNDEIGLLANNFETMRSAINKKMSDLATLNSIGEVLAVLLDQNKGLGRSAENHALSTLVFIRGQYF